MANILIIFGNTKTKSFGKALVDSYEKGARAGVHNVRRINLRDLKFDPILWEGLDKPQKLEQGLVEAQKSISWADHLVFEYPNWWMVAPAILKGFIDRTFTSGFAFRYVEGKLMPEKLLKGKSARLLVTMDLPPMGYWLMFGSPGHKMMKRGVLKFCGIKPVRISSFGSLRKSSDEKKAKWLMEVERLGRKAK